ncbi:MAG: DEAD/DEAH box helicase, partial [Acidobacteria bacterium]|nr:DEAD/DEAH box helicase [Acidobacteriota bacterium]
MAGSYDGLRRVLALERDKKFSDSAVVGGLDEYLLRFTSEAKIDTSHPISRILQQLPPGGYRALHPIQRQRVVDELLRSADNGAQREAARHLPVEPAPPPREKPAVLKPASRPKASAKPERKLVSGLTIDSPVSALGPTRPDLRRLQKIGIETVRDLLYHFPKRYHDYSEVRPIAGLAFGEEQTVIAEVWSAKAVMIGRKRRGAEAIVGDDSGTIRVLWFGQPWVAKRLKTGTKVALSGKIGSFKGRMQMQNPEIESLDDEAIFTRRFVPVYGSTDGLYMKTLRDLVRLAVDSCAADVPETLPDDERERHGLMGAPEALRQIHAPESLAEADAARQRFAFEELLWIEIGVVRRRQWQVLGGAPVLSLDAAALSGFIESLPFELTKAQHKAIDEVLADIADSIPMTRLLEGDVGSGKTVVAAAPLLAAVASGKQSAILAPTEILAEQHMRTFTSILDPQPAAG